MEYKSCCFTGHRPSKFPFKYDETDERCLELKSMLRLKIINLINYSDVRNFIVGMALGVDTWAAEIVLEIKELYSDIRLIAAVPCPEQTKGWSKENQARYDNILDLCDEVVTISDRWTSSCMMKRNKYMVDNSDFVIAVWNGEFSGGTAKTLGYARKKGHTPIIIKC